MDEEERQKKIQASKEKLLAFQKKKSKKRKKKLEGADGGDSVSSDSLSTYSYEDSDRSIASGDDLSGGENDSSTAFEAARREQKEMYTRILELEESLEGKKIALQDIQRENELLRSQQSTQPGALMEKEKEYKTIIEQCQAKIQEYHAALQQRDEYIRQLSSTEQSQLLQQVQSLQTQLKNAEEILQTQRGPEKITEDLIAAKTDVLNQQKALEDGEKTNKELSNVIEQQKLTIKQLENDNQQSETAKSELVANLKQYETDIQQQKSVIETLMQNGQQLKHEADLVKHSDKIDTHDQKIVALDAENKQQLQQLRAELEELHGEQLVQIKDGLREQHKAASETQHSELNQRCLHFENESKQYQQAYQEAYQKLATLAEYQLPALVDENKQYKQRLEELGKTQETSDTTVKKLEKAITENNEYKTQIDQLDALVQDLTATLQVNTQDKQKLLSESQQLRDEVESYKLQLETVSKDGLPSHGQPESLQSELLEERHRTIQELQGEVNDLAAKLQEMKTLNEKLDTRAKYDLDLLKEDMTFHHESTVQKLKVELAYDHEQDLKKVKKEFEDWYNHKLQSAKSQFDMKFVEELQKAKLEITRKHEQDLQNQEIKYIQESLHQTTGECNEELSEIIIKLTKENRDLLEAKSTLMDQVGTLSHQIEGLQEDYLAIKADNENLVEQTGSLTRKLEQFQNRGSFEDMSEHADGEWRVKYDSLIKENQSLRTQLSHLTPGGTPEGTIDLASSFELKTAQSKFDELCSENSSLKEEIKMLKENLEQGNLELDAMQNNYMHLLDENEQLKGQGEGLAEPSESARDEIEQILGTPSTSSIPDMDTLVTDCEDLRNERESLRVELDNLREHNIHLEEQIMNLKNSAEQAQQQYNDLKLNYDEVILGKEDNDKTLKELKEELNKKSQELQTVKEELDRTQEQYKVDISTLETELQALESKSQIPSDQSQNALDNQSYPALSKEKTLTFNETNSILLNDTEELMVKQTDTPLNQEPKKTSGEMFTSTPFTNAPRAVDMSESVGEVESLIVPVDDSHTFAPPPNLKSDSASSFGQGSVASVTDVGKVALQVKMLEDRNNQLDEDNKSLRSKLTEQEKILDQLRQDLSTSGDVSDDVQKAFGQQVSLLQQERDELLKKIDEQTTRDQQLSGILGEKGLLEENLRREKELLAERLHEREALEIELLQCRTTLERQKREQEKLKEALHEKDRAEQELKQEKGLLETSLSGLESQLQERDQQLQTEVQSLQQSISEKQEEFTQREAEIVRRHEENVSHVKENLERTSLVRIQQAMVDVDRQHTEAVARLRSEMSSEFDARESRLHDDHSAHVTGLQTSHRAQMESLKAEYQEQISSLRGELDLERRQQLGQVKVVHEKQREREMTELQLKHNQELEELRSKLDTSHQSVFDEMKIKLEEGKRMEITHLNEAHQDELKEQLEALKSSLEESHASIIEKTKTELEDQKTHELDELTDNLMKERNKDLDNIEDKKHNEVEELKERHNREMKEKLDEMNDEYKKMVEKLKEDLHLQHTKDLEALTVDYKGQIEVLQEQIKQGVTQVEVTKQEESEARTDMETVLKERDLVLEQAESMRQNLQKATQDAIAEEKQAIQKEYEQLLSDQEESLKVQITEHAQMVQQLNDRLQLALSDHKHLEDQINSITQDKETTVKAIEKLKLEHESEMKELRTYFEKRVQDSEKDFEDELSQLKSTYEDKISSLKRSQSFESPRPQELNESEEERRLASERDYFKSGMMLTAIDDLDSTPSNSPPPQSPRHSLNKGASIEDLENQVELYKTQLENVKRDLESQHSAELENIKSQFEFKSELDIKKLKSDLEESHAKTVGELQAEHIKELDNVRAKCDDNMTKELTRLRLEAASNSARQAELETSQLKEELQAQFSTEVQNMKESHQADIENLDKQHNRTLEVEIAKHQTTLQEAHANEIRTLEENHMVTVEDLSRSETDKLDKLQSDLERTHQDEVNALNEEFKVKLDEAKGEFEKEKNHLEEKIGEDELKYEKLKQELQSGESPEMLQLVKQQQEEIEVAKRTMQEEYDELIRIVQQQASENLQVEQAKFMEKHQKLVDDLVDSTRKDKEEIEEKHQKELNDLRDTTSSHLGQDIERLKVVHMEEIQKIESELSAKGQQEIEELKSHHEEDIEEMKIKLKEELLSEQMKKAELIRAELVQEHEHNVDSMKEAIVNECEEKLANVLTESVLAQAELKQHIEKLQESHADDLSKTLDLHKEEVEQLKIALSAANEDAIGAMTSDTDHTMADLEEAHRKEILQLQERLAAKYKNEMDIVEDDYKKQIEILTAKHKAEVSRLQDENIKEIEDLKKEFEEAMQQSVEEMQSEKDQQRHNQIDVLRQSLQAGTEDMKSQLVAINIEKEEHMKKEFEKTVEKLKQEHESEIASKSSTIDDLQSRIDELLKEKEEIEERIEKQQDQHLILLGRRERESEEDDNLVSMLRSDLDRQTAERNAIQKSNDRLLLVLSEHVKNNQTTEDLINKRLTSLIKSSTPVTSRGASPAGGASGIGRPSTPPGAEGGEDTVLDTTGASDEGLDLSHRISDSIFMGPELDPAGEEIITESNRRLHLSIENLLGLITQTTQQVREAQTTQLELVEMVESIKQENEAVKLKCEETEQRLSDETESREYLALELNKAEGLIDGYAAEKSQLEETLNSLEDKKEGLIVELETTKIRLQEYELSHAELHSQAQEIDRQRVVLEQSLGQQEQACPELVTLHEAESDTELLKENSKLGLHNRELEHQLHKDRNQLEENIRELEQSVEDLRLENDQIVENNRAEKHDLLNQFDAIEKQLKANKQFLEDQASEREQERDDFQREIDKLEEQIRERDRISGIESSLQNELKEFEQHLKDKTDECTLIEQSLKERQHSLEQLQSRLETVRDNNRQLEVDLANTSESKAAVSEKNKQLTNEIENQQKVIQQLEKQLESYSVDTFKTIISDLENQLEGKAQSEELLKIKNQELEEELNKQRQVEQELIHEKDALQKQVYEYLGQISALRSDVDERRHITEMSESDRNEELMKALNSEQEIIKQKTEEIASLCEQLDDYQQKVLDGEDELQQLHLQIEVSNKELESTKQDSTEKNSSLEQQIRHLQEQNHGLQSEVDSTPMPEIAQILINEKNEEIEYLTRQLDELQRHDSVEHDGNVHREVEKLAKANDEKEVEIQSKITEITELRSALEDMKTADMKNAEEKEQESEDMTGKLEQYERALEDLKVRLQQKTEECNHFQDEMIQKDFHLVKLKEELTATHGQELASLQENVADKEGNIEELSTQIETLQSEVKSLTEFQLQLQDDFDTVQTMLEEKQKEVETLTQELDNNRTSGDGVTEAQMKYDQEIDSLTRQLVERQSAYQQEVDRLQAQIDELSNLPADVERLTSEIEMLDAIIAEKDSQMTDLNESLLSHHTEPKVDVELAEQLKQALESKNQLTSHVKSLKTQHKSELKLLREHHQVEVGEINQKITEAVSKARSDLDKQYGEKLSELQRHYEQQLDQYRDPADSVSVTEMKDRFRSELDTMARLDESIIGHLRRQQISPDTSVVGAQSLSSLPLDVKEILERLHGQALQNMSLSELEFLQRQVRSPQVTSQGINTVPINTTASSEHGSVREAWENEKRNLLSTIQSMKDLLAQVQAPLLGSGDGESDWRADLIKAINYIFQQELDQLTAELRTNVVSLDVTPTEIHDLETKIQDQAARNESSTRQIYAADRQSLLAEIRDLRAHLTVSQTSNQGELLEQQMQELKQLKQRVDESHDEASAKERELQCQLDLLEFKLQQEKVIQVDIEKSLEAEKRKVGNLTEHLTREKNVVNELHSEVSVLQSENSNLKMDLDNATSRLKHNLTALEEERSQTGHLRESFDKEKMISEQLRDALEDERKRLTNVKEREASTLEKIREELQNEKEQRIHLQRDNQQARIACDRLKRDLENEEIQNQTSENQYKTKLFELQGLADTAQGKIEEINRALHREQSLNVQLEAALKDERMALHNTSHRERNNIFDLQALLDLERSKVMDLQEKLERQKSKVSKLNTSLETEKMAANDDLNRERSLTRQLKKQLDILQAQKEEAHQNISILKDKSAHIQTEKDHLHATLNAIRQQGKEDSVRRQDEKQEEQSRLRTFQQEREALRQREQNNDAEIQRLQRKVVALETQLSDYERIAANRQTSPRAQSAYDVEEIPRTSERRSPYSPRIQKNFDKEFAALRDQVKRLSDEKKELRRTMTNLEEEVWQYRQQDSTQKPHHTRLSLDAIESLLSTERANWSCEKSSLQIALRQTENEIAQLKVHIHELENNKVPHISLPGDTGSHRNYEKERALKLKFFRAESHRKALVYQKKYLLTLLGGFQDTEKETLSMIAQMGVYPSSENSHRRSRRGRGFTRFRTAARVVIAIARMKSLHQKWKKANSSLSTSLPVHQSSHRQHRSETYRSDMPRSEPRVPPMGEHCAHHSAGQGYALPSHGQHRLYMTPPTKERSASPSQSASPPKRKLLSALDPPKKASPTPSPSITSNDAPRTPETSVNGTDYSLHDDYIQRLENLQQRLGNVATRGSQPQYGTAKFGTFRR